MTMPIFKSKSVPVLFKAGLALAASMQQRNEVIACFFGEGAVAEGEFHESMNLAQLWRLPVLSWRLPARL